MTESPFTVGTMVAVIGSRGFSGVSIRRCKVWKVRKDGKFFLSFMRHEAGKPSEEVKLDQMWTPTGNGTARMSGSHSYRDHVEVWTTEHDGRVAELKAKAAYQKVKAVVAEAINALNPAEAHDRKTMDMVHQLLSDRSPGGALSEE